MEWYTSICIVAFFIFKKIELNKSSNILILKGKFIEHFKKIEITDKIPTVLQMCTVRSVHYLEMLSDNII